MRHTLSGFIQYSVSLSVQRSAASVDVRVVAGRRQQKPGQLEHERSRHVANRICAGKPMHH